MEGFSEHAPANDEDNSTNGDVDIKYPAPGQILGDQTSNGRPRANAESYNNSIQTECAPALARRKGTRNHRSIDGKDERSTYSLEETGDDKYGQGRRCPAEDGAKNEDDQPCFIDWLTPDHIGQASESQQERSNNDQIANDDPFDGSADANAKGVRDGWQSNVHNRGIQGRHKATQCDEEEHDPFVRLFLRIASCYRYVKKAGKVHESVCGIESRRGCLVCLTGRICRGGSFPPINRGATVRGLDLIHGLLLVFRKCLSFFPGLSPQAARTILHHLCPPSRTSSRFVL